MSLIVSQALSNLTDLLDWEASPDKLLLKSCEDLKGIDPRFHERSKVLICHDLKDGYLDDRFLLGCSNTDGYRFWHWWQADIFVYFSHKFVTIPPTCWIDAGHKHSVCVLGTVITEWEEGKNLCSQFLKTKELTERTVDKLVEIANFYGFDGWLINIENELTEDMVDSMKHFVSYLTREMRKHNKHSQVIWYDSVTKIGKLDWQNELNSNNRDFFDCCDGIFLNYTWKDDNLKASCELAQENNRVHDVYVGVDVFGRGCMGGFDSARSFESARARDLSIALFAQSWTYEKRGEKDFLANECRFWNSLKDYCPKRFLVELPLVTSFCQGWGNRYYWKGKVLSDYPWTNLSLQQVQPTNSSLSYNVEDAFNGGGCLQITGTTDEEMFTNEKILLYNVDSLIEDELFILVKYKNVFGEISSLLLILNDAADSTVAEYELRCTDDRTSDEINSSSSSVRNCIYSLPCLAAGEDDQLWTTRKFFLSGVNNRKLTEVSVLTSPNDSNQSNVLIGLLQIIPKKLTEEAVEYRTQLSSICWEKFLFPVENRDSEYLDSVVQIAKSIENDNSFDILLTWTMPVELTSKISIYHVYLWSSKTGQWSFLGPSPTTGYSWSLLKSDIVDQVIKIKIEPILKNTLHDS